MKITFGIITGGENSLFNILKILNSIRSQSIPEYEIIIVGGDNHYQSIPNVRHFPFSEQIKYK
jgi:hypothetical protein